MNDMTGEDIGCMTRLMCLMPPCFNLCHALTYVTQLAKLTPIQYSGSCVQRTTHQDSIIGCCRSTDMIHSCRSTKSYLQKSVKDQNDTYLKPILVRSIQLSKNTHLEIVTRIMHPNCAPHSTLSHIWRWSTHSTMISVEVLLRPHADSSDLD